MSAFYYPLIFIPPPSYILRLDLLFPRHGRLGHLALGTAMIGAGLPLRNRHLVISRLGRRVFAPEVLLATGKSDSPRGENAAGNAPGPTISLIIVGRHDASAGRNLDEPNNGVEQHVGADTGNQTIGDRVRERHDGNGEECGHRITHIPPVDLGNCADHHGADEDQNAAGGPRRDRCENRREEDGDEEADAGNHRSQSSLSTLGNTSTRLNKGSDGRNTKDGTNGDAQGIHHVCNGGTLKVLGDRVDDVGETGHAVESTCTIQNVDIQKGDEGESKLATVTRNVELEDVEGVFDLVEVNHLLEEVEPISADGVIGEVSDRGISRPGDDADEEDSGNDSALDAVQHEQDGEDTATEDADPHGRVSHLMRGRA